MSTLTADERRQALDAIARPSTTPGARLVLQQMLDASASAPAQHVKDLQAAMARDPALARFCRDLRLEAGAGSQGGKYSVTEVNRRLDEIGVRYPTQYGTPSARIAIKMKLLAAGVMAAK